MKNEKCSAWIVSSKDRGRKKIYRGKETGNRRVYLKDGDEFEIELYNPTENTYMAKIEMDGKLISNSGILIKPGQRLYLKRFIDDNKSFIFETYDVDNTSLNQKAISDNGKVTILFYEEMRVLSNEYLNQIPLYNNYGYPHYFQYTTSFYNNSSDLSNNSITSNLNNNIETGQTSKGNETDQKLRYVDVDFNSYPSYSEIYYILPESRKLKTKSDYDRITEGLEKTESLITELFSKKDKFNFDNVVEKLINNNELDDLFGSKKDNRSESDKIDELYSSLDKLGNLFDRQLITKEEFNDRKEVIMRETK